MDSSVNRATPLAVVLVGETTASGVARLVDETTGEAVPVTFRGTHVPISLHATAGGGCGATKKRPPHQNSPGLPNSSSIIIQKVEVL